MRASALFLADCYLVYKETIHHPSINVFALIQHVSHFSDIESLEYKVYSFCELIISLLLL